jgi:hypothetical protein
MCRYAAEGLGDPAGVLAPGLVPIGHDRDLRAAQRLCELVPPLARTAGVTGGDHAQAFELVYVALALNDHHVLAALDGFEHARKAVEHPPGLVKLPRPAAVAVGPTLAEALRREPDRLEEQLLVLVDIGIRRHDLPEATLAVERVAVEQGAHTAREPSRGHDLLDRTPVARMTLHERTILGLLHREGRLSIIVRRASRRPPRRTGRANAVEPFEERFRGAHSGHRHQTDRQPAAGSARTESSRAAAIGCRST